ncbi:hypothetical protein D3C86_1256370 [compost metagenome]
MVAGVELAFGDHLAHQPVDHLGVLGVDGDQRAEIAGLAHDLEEARVVDPDGALVGHEGLEGGDPRLDHPGQLAADRVSVVGHGHVEGVVADGLAARLGVPDLQGVHQGLAALGHHEVDDPGGAADGRGPGAGLEVVGRDRAHEGHVQVGVDVDPAGEDVAAAGVDDPVAGSGVEGGGDRLDDAVLHVDVGAHALGGRDDVAVLDQGAHRVLLGVGSSLQFTAWPEKG